MKQTEREKDNNLKLGKKIKNCKWKENRKGIGHREKIRKKCDVRRM